MYDAMRRVLLSVFFAAQVVMACAQVYPVRAELDNKESFW